ncbi:MAG: SpoIIE family protein phosphatase [Bacteroidales bacterium]|jgi:sigma-B regulation protein RsbU (phosphoserine phosphatase)|nr:serine/threonine protein phosphatase [Bacteroidales bacterium]MBP5418362.1 SpoIIE family protein phosphatase [Bacteroidales bacterium]MCR5695695.1 SpoIIE family protein phosphatase [Marinilabiliaceae bacterium]
MERKSNVRLYKERLNLLLDVAQIVNEDHTIDDLMNTFKNLLQEELGIGKILVYTLNYGTWVNLLASNISEEQLAAINVQRDLSHISQIEIIAGDNEALRGIDAVIPLYHKFHIISYVLIGDSELGDGVSPTLRNLKFVQILANLIIVFIENKKLQQQLIKQETLRRELEVAATIQEGLVPGHDDLPHSKFLRVRTLYKPHLGVGGDYYDVIQLSRTRIGFCIADVSGKGISAALLMSNFQAIVRSLFTSTIDLRVLLNELNRRVCKITSEDKFLTLFIGRYDKLTGRISYINAGHLPPIVYNPLNDSMVLLERGCIGIGMLENLPQIDVGHINIGTRTRFLAYTDGLVEIDNGCRIEDATQDLKDIMRKSTNIVQVVNRVEEIANTYSANGLAFDDISVLAFEFKRRGLFAPFKS